MVTYIPSSNDSSSWRQPIAKTHLGISFHKVPIQVIQPYRHHYYSKNDEAIEVVRPRPGMSEPQLHCPKVRQTWRLI